MKLPTDVLPGQPVSAKDFNSLLRYVRANSVNGGPGIRVTRSANGVSIASTSQTVKSSRGGGGTTSPFKVSTDGLDATVAPGTCNGDVPEISGTPLDDDPAPTLTLTDDATNYILLRTEGSFDTTTGVETIDISTVESGTSIPSEVVTDTDWTAYAVIAVVVVASGAATSISQLVDSNVNGQNFGFRNYYYDV